MILRQLLLGSMANFGYLVGDETTGRAAVIDPSFDGRPLQREAGAQHLTVELVLVTHGHPDHVADVGRLAQETGAKVVAHRLSRVPKQIALEDGDRVPLGTLSIEALHTPGHAPDSICYRVGDALFTGDTLFVGACGRIDLQGSDPAAMHDSLVRRIRGLDDDLVVYPGHDYGEAPYARLGDEKRTNPTLAPRTFEEFIRFMSEP